VPSFTFDEALHEYRLDGRRLPSVTQIIAPLKDFAGVPADVLERKRALGVAVHKACELDDLGELDDETTAPLVLGHVRGWRRFKVEHRVAVLLNERQLYHPTLRFAGTLDRVCGLASDTTASVWLLDLKTSADALPSYGVQLAGYQLLLPTLGDDCPPVPNRGALLLRDDGTYKLQQYRNPNDEACFRALLSVHHWKESNQ
jgi:hypothetical protein